MRVSRGTPNTVLNFFDQFRGFLARSRGARLQRLEHVEPLLELHHVRVLIIIALCENRALGFDAFDIGLDGGIADGAGEQGAELEHLR